MRKEASKISNKGQGLAVRRDSGVEIAIRTYPVTGDR